MEPTVEPSVFAPSAGEQAYLAYWRAWPALPPMTFGRLCREERRAWDAAAKAIITAWQAHVGAVNGQAPPRRKRA